jgi:hypothetical protein
VTSSDAAMISNSFPMKCGLRPARSIMVGTILFSALLLKAPGTTTFPDDRKIDLEVPTKSGFRKLTGPTSPSHAIVER